VIGQTPTKDYAPNLESEGIVRIGVTKVRFEDGSVCMQAGRGVTFDVAEVARAELSAQSELS
jgi:hypothetical protein